VVSVIFGGSIRSWEIEEPSAKSPVVSVIFGGSIRSWEIEEPPAKAWWCRSYSAARFVAGKLMNHRLKPGGVGHGILLAKQIGSDCRYTYQRSSNTTEVGL
jgi:hypothetical protein